MGDAIRPQGREHIPALPKLFIAVRFIQFFLAIIIMGLTAFGLWWVGAEGGTRFTGAALTMFSTIVTLIVSLYVIVATFFAAKLYNYWAILGLDIFLAIFWLISFAVLASQIAPFMELLNYIDSDFGFYYYYDNALAVAFGGSMSAVAGLGGLQFLLFVICLIVGGIFLHKHRAAGLHSRTGVARTEKPAVAPAPMYGAPVAYGMAPQHTGTFPQQAPYQVPQHTGYAPSANTTSMYGAPQGYGNIPPPMPGNTTSMYGAPQQTGTPVQQQAPYQVPQHTGTPSQQGGYAPPAGDIAQPTPQYPPQSTSPLQTQNTGPPAQQTSPPAGGHSYGPGTNSAPYQPPGQ